MTRPEMEALGFRYMGACNCDGTINYKYDKGEYRIYIRPKRHNFHVKKIVNYIKKNEPLRNLDETIKNLSL